MEAVAQCDPRDRRSRAPRAAIALQLTVHVIETEGRELPARSFAFAYAPSFSSFLRMRLR